MNESYLLRNAIKYNNSISITALNPVIKNIIYKTQPQESAISLLEEKFVPLSIVSGKSSLEAIVLYLKDFSRLKFKDIAKLLNRDQRTIWVTYANAKKKKLILDTENHSQLMLPLNIFYSRNFSILENIVLYLRTTQSLSFNQISDLIGKNYQTVRTVYKRALRKIDQKKYAKHER
jgi:transposase-like protein